MFYLDIGWPSFFTGKRSCDGNITPRVIGYYIFMVNERRPVIGRVTLNLLQNQSYHMLFHMTGQWVASGVRNSKLLPLARDTFLLHN